MGTSTKVVVTGLGATTPLGGDVASTWEGALAGRSGVRTLEYDWVAKYDMPVTFAGQLVVPPEAVLQRTEIRRMDPTAQYAIIATREAWKDAGSPDVPGERLGAVVSTGIGGVWTMLNAWDTVRDKGPRRVLPLSVPMLMPNSPVAYVSIEVGAKAGAHALVSACASGAEAIGYGVDMIRAGRADVVVAGGTEAATPPLPMATFAKMQALSTRNEDPAGASRPYDVTRDGFVLGEGSGIVILESEAHAKARGARIYAEISGVGLSADAYDVAPPDPSGEGQERAMRLALADAGLSGRDVVHVNAHATSTPVGDGIEAKAIHRMLGGDASHAVVSATKSMTGHLLGAAGGVEAVFTVLAMRDQVAPPTINLDNPDPGCDLDFVPNAARDMKINIALSNSFGFGGTNGTLVFRRLGH